MTTLRTVVLALALAVPMLIASQPASATGSCFTLTKWGVGVTEGMAAAEAQWLVGAKRAIWTKLKPRGYVNAGPMQCGRLFFVHTCNVPTQVCK